MLVAAIFILVVGSINYINLTTARSSRRMKESGVRKLLGSSRKQLFFQFLAESLLVNVAALAIALLLVLFSLPFYFQLLDRPGGLLGDLLVAVDEQRLVLAVAAGLPALLVLCVGWALLDFVDAHAWGVATEAIGPRPWEEWRTLGQPLSLLFNGPMSLQPALFTQLLRIVLLAATFDRAVASLRAARG